MKNVMLTKKRRKEAKMARHSKSDGTSCDIKPQDGKRFSLGEAQRLVGGYVQVIQLSDSVIMLMDEEGKLKGKPVNESATAIAQLKKAIYPNDCVVGDVVICRSDEF